MIADITNIKVTVSYARSSFEERILQWLAMDHGISPGLLTSRTGARRRRESRVWRARESLRLKDQRYQIALYCAQYEQSMQEHILKLIESPKIPFTEQGIALLSDHLNP